jgi:hypothetical protein
MEDNNFQSVLKNKFDEFKSKINRNKYIEKKFEFKIKKKIFHLLQDIGAGIYGGSILDEILHEDGSKRFYTFYDKYTNDNTILLPCDNNNIYILSPLSIYSSSSSTSTSLHIISPFLIHHQTHST